MTTEAAFIQALSSHIGTLEAPPNSNCQPFSAELGRPCEAWCADFIAACAKDVGLALPSTSAYTPTMADGFRRAGRFFHDPQPGDIGFVDFPNDNTHGIQHVWVVTAVQGTNLLTVEGNTSPGITGSQDNGGGVFNRLRPQAWVVGYGRPQYDAAAPVVAPGAVVIPDEEAEMGCVVDRPQGGYIVVAHDGGVFCYDDAPFHGAIPGNPAIKLGGNIVGGCWTQSGEGYWLVGADGAVFSFGDAQYHGGFNAESPQTRGSRYGVGIATAGNGYRVVTFDPSNDGSPYDAYSYGV